MIYHVVAAARKNVIGFENKLPWHFSSDLQHFKKMTLGHIVLMGRKTFESIGKPLPGRENWVLSRQPHEKADSLSYFSSFPEAMRAAQDKTCFIIGGAGLYEQTLPFVDGIYMTRIHADFQGDAFYPEVPAGFSEHFQKKLQEDPYIEVIFYLNHQKKELP